MNSIQPEEDGSTSDKFRLMKETELRFEVEHRGIAELILKSGTAEIFGTELVQDKIYSFYSGAKCAVFTWYGAVVVLRGRVESKYVSKTDTPMVMYANTHAAIEQLRVQAQQSGGQGPRIMVCGPTDVGKTTLCQILLNYGVRCGRSPTFIDLDVGQNSISIPGSIGALVVDRVADPQYGFHPDAPLIYHFGHTSPGPNVRLYGYLVQVIAQAISERFAINRKADISGMIINTCGWIKGGGYSLLLTVAMAAEVDAVIVLDQEKTYNDLKKDLPSFVKVVLMPKSGGVVERSLQFRKTFRDAQIRQYFYGIRDAFHPHTFSLPFDSLTFYKVGAPQLSKSLLPFGADDPNFQMQIIEVAPGPAILHKVCSLSLATQESELVDSNVGGFVIITKVDMIGQMVTVLSPRPAPLPNSHLMVSDISFMDLE